MGIQQNKLLYQLYMLYMLNSILQFCIIFNTKCSWLGIEPTHSRPINQEIQQSFSWTMGASAPPAYSPFNWLQTGPSTYINRSTNQAISFKQVPLSASNPIHSYKARLGLSHKNIVKLLHFSTAPNASSTCSEDEAKLDVYIEGGLKKLMDFQGNVYNGSRDVRNGRTCFCGQVVSGFQALKQWVGGFQVSEGMVWVGIDGNVKVWGNTDPFNNNFVSAKQSVMVLQIKQILIKLQCKCNYSNSSNLTFDTLTKNNKTMHIHPPQQFQPSISNITSPKFSSNMKQQHINQTTLGSPNRSTHSNPSNDTIFYYPKNSMTDTKKLFSSVKYRTTGNVRDHHLSQTQNIYQSRETVNRSGYQSNNEKKNRSTVVAVNSKCMSPKVSFHYDNNSNRGTPKKVLAQFRPESPKSTITSPAQLLSPKISHIPHIPHQDHKPQPSQPTINRFQMYSEPYTFKTEKKIKKTQQEEQVELHIVEERSSLVSNNQNLMSPYENLGSQKLVKMLSEPDRGMSFGVQGIATDDNLWDWGGRDQVFSKGMIYQNSYTDRQGHSSHLDNSKMRGSAESQKLQQAMTDIEYKIPQKTRLLIKKYLFEKSEQNLIENRQAKQTINNSFLKYKNEQDKIRNTLDEVNKTKEQLNQEMQIKQEKQKKTKSPLRVQLIRLLQDEDHDEKKYIVGTDNPNKHPQLSNPRKQAACQEEPPKADLNKKQKKILRDQMQRIFNFNPQDEQQSKIRKKVAEKKAIFADLKKQASKILDSHSQS